MPVFEARGVWKRYGATVALSEVTVDYDAGLNLIMGPNGSGKSTLLRILVGLTKPSKGIVRSFGVDPWRHRTGILKRTGLAVEGQYLPPLAPGREYLRLFAKNRGLGWSELERIAGELGVTGYWDKPIASYSMGMRKRILLAQAFLGARDALVLDEPYTLLDPRTVGVVNKLIEEHARDIP
ncbi:MAG: ABC transporter ATP-binding protein, partial [Desulfurococcales archaeon]|nr:ABC transporter ATP-binding protein [Desulfurococcales archaeon]